MSKAVARLRDLKSENISNFGGKATNLAILLQNNIPVPDGVAVGLDAFKNDGQLTENAKKEISSHLIRDKLYAVRSSALSEDTVDASWAGQFESFLDVKPEEVLAKVEECHNSAKKRAKSYANDKKIDSFNIAVVIQEMLAPEYAGVLFTKDPLTGDERMVTEYVEGLGEELVSGRADPKRAILNTEDANELPFSAAQLSDLALKVEQIFNTPQDIEWVWNQKKIWLVQARPITATQKSREKYYLGEPADLFYWGPSRAKPIYMSDFMAAAEQLFLQMAGDKEMPNPPKTVVLFDEGKMVWLSNAQEFVDFTKLTFKAYEKLDRIDNDIRLWNESVKALSRLSGKDRDEGLVKSWLHTEFAEFSLYGAETVLIERLSRFDNETRQSIWSAFTVPDNEVFLSRIDKELALNKDPVFMASKYPWIQDGYDGVSGNAEEYFCKRLKIIGDEIIIDRKDVQSIRNDLEKRLKLTTKEVQSLNLTRKLAEFMDNRKAWMMQTRCLISHNVGKINHGWFFDNGKTVLIGQDDTHELWQRYVEFKSSSSAVTGVVASNGGKHFINGEAVIVTDPNDAVEDGKIIIVPSTSPSYVPLMRKAKALVTDHGGMMSHAAIVAREFNLPCIVGTRQATKLIKTGDKVVLDLIRGEVRK